MSCLLCFRADQAVMAAFFSACFLVLAASPAKLKPASSTLEAKTGEWPGPERTVVYAGSFSPARCAVSCSRFLYTPVSSCTPLAATTHQPTQLSFEYTIGIMQSKQAHRGEEEEEAEG